MPKNNDIKIRNKSRKKRNLRTPFGWTKALGIVLLIPVIVILFIIGILYTSTFDFQYQPKTFANYYQEVKGTGVQSFTIEGNLLSFDIPAEVLGTELWLRMDNLQGSSPIKVKQVGLNETLDKIQVNTNFYGLNVPISLEFKPVVADNRISLSFDQITFGEGGITLKNRLGEKILEGLLGENRSIMIEAKEIIGSNLLTVQSLTFHENKGQIQLAVDTNQIITDINQLKMSANEEMILWTQEGLNEVAKSALNILLEADQMTPQQFDVLIQDSMTNQELISNLFLYSNPKTISELLERYGKYLSRVTPESVLALQIAHSKQPLNKIYTDLMDAMNQNQEFQDQIIINQKKIYNLVSKEYVSLEEIVEMSNGSLSMGLQEKLGFCYDYSRDQLLLNYSLDDGQKLLADSENIWKIDQTEFEENFGVPDFGIPEFVTDVERYQKIETLLAEFFGTEKVLIRYLKADEKYAYAIASSPESYQNYVVFILTVENEKWAILQNELDQLADFNFQYPDFNMELMLFEEDVVLYNVDAAMQDMIYRDLKERKIIKGSDETLDYISYGNGYIALMLSNGEKYIYRLNKLFLETVYSQEQALKAWDNIPDIITLQSME